MADASNNVLFFLFITANDGGATALPLLKIHHSGGFIRRLTIHDYDNSVININKVNVIWLLIISVIT
ncbi:MULTISPECIES: hypothetical protein [Dickeya]|uniref:Uncharacterized protein n=1 Tax=Dickeya aquatica TaxID=1401087 RepID=A0A375AB67_9GAMM|nr:MULTISPECIES: hypothetical protein [Dickeya]SLM63290.1 hypothetical protein DAQ1742_02402 [Dickeya aquatica]